MGISGMPAASVEEHPEVRAEMQPTALQLMVAEAELNPPVALAAVLIQAIQVHSASVETAAEGHLTLDIPVAVAVAIMAEPAEQPRLAPGQAMVLQVAEDHPMLAGLPMQQQHRD
jgi:hypothetical protein